MSHTTSETLYRLARSDNANDRETLALSITELLQKNLTRGETLLVQDLLLRLLKEAEDDLRLSLAQQFSQLPQCPQPLVDYLLFECPLIQAKPILRDAAYLEEAYLIDAARRFDDPRYWRVMAERKHITKAVSLVLIETQDNEVHDLIVRNEGAELCNTCMMILTDLATTTPRLQQPLLLRSEITAELAARIYWHASKALQEDIERRFALNKTKLQRTINYIAMDRAKKRATVRTIPMEMLDLVRKMPTISTRQIFAALEKNDRALFACLVGQKLDINPERVLHKLHVDLPEHIAMLGRALRLTRGEFHTLYLGWRRGGDTDKTVHAAEVQAAHDHFQRLKINDVLKLLPEWNVVVEENDPTSDDDAWYIDA